MPGLAAEGADPGTVMIDATHLKAHRTACSLRAKKWSPAARPGERRGSRDRKPDSFARERNTKLHAVTDPKGRPIRLFLSAGQASDYTGAALLGQPAAGRLASGGPGYGAEWIRKAFENKGMKARIPGRKSRQKAVKYDRRRYRRRTRIEIMFDRLEDCRRVAMRSDRCPQTCLSAIALAGTVLFWL